MNKCIVFMALITLLCSSQTYTYAQFDENIKFRDVRVECDGENVDVSLRLNLQGYYVGLGDSVTLTPQIKAGDNILSLPQVVLIGLGDYGYYLSNRSRESEKPFRVLNPAQQERISYHTTTPREAWMNDAVLSVKTELFRSEVLFAYSNQLNSKAHAGNYRAVRDDVLATLTNDNRGFKIYEFRLPGKYSMLEGNSNDVENVRNIIRQIMASDSLVFVSACITAYTSVDGIYMDNDKLTMKQSYTFKEKLMDGLHCSPSQIYVEWAGEDWTGLANEVRESGMMYRDEVLNIINHTGVFKGRERKLMLLGQGSPYRFMKEYLFPKQCRIECKIIYTRK